MDYRSQLIALADAYEKATGRSRSRVATIVCGSGAFFSRIAEGKGCGVDTYLAVKAWFHAHWPAATAWPAGVDLPGHPPNYLPAVLRAEALGCTADRSAEAEPEDPSDVQIDCHGGAA